MSDPVVSKRDYRKAQSAVESSVNAIQSIVTHGTRYRNSTLWGDENLMVKSKQVLRGLRDLAKLIEQIERKQTQTQRKGKPDADL